MSLDLRDFRRGHLAAWLVGAGVVLGLVGAAPVTSFAQSADDVTPAAAAPLVIHVSPTGRTGGAGTPTDPLLTITEAWQRIPVGTTLTRGVTIALAPGEYPRASMPHYWENRHGTATAPITITSAGAPRSAVLRGDLNLFDIDHLRIEGLRIVPGGDVVHCEQCGFVTVSQSILDGGGAAHETYKANQSHDLTIVNSHLRGADENAIDFVAVQRATIERNIISDAGDWCAYVKGGSTAITVRSNEIRNCGTGGFTAGQGTGLEFMVAPWLTYEATDVVFAGNFIHDTEGAAFGVNGGRNITIEDNVATRVGTRSHVLEVTFGLRSCDGDVAQCAALLAAGAWGTSVADGGTTSAYIPDRDVTIRRNAIVNPAGVRSAWQHFEISNPRTNTGQAIGPSPARTDEGLRITGNVIRNGGSDMPLGIDDTQVCRSTNPTCTVAQLRRDNDINGAAAVAVPTAVPGGIVPGPGTPPATPAPSSAPGGPRATPGNGAMVAWWGTPAAGATSHRATATPARGGAPRSCVATAERFCTITGLVNGTAYRVTIVGVNSAGDGPAAQVPGLTVPRARCTVTPPAPPNPAMAAAINARLATDPIFAAEFGAELGRQAPCNPGLGRTLSAAIAEAIRQAPDGPVAQAIREAMREAAQVAAEVRSNPGGEVARRVAAERAIN